MPVFSNTIIILIAILLVTYYFVPAERRKHVGTLLILVCSIYVGSFFVQVFKGQARPAGVLATVAEERAELALRMMTTVNVGVAKFVKESKIPLGDSKDPNKSIIEVSSENLGIYFDQAKKALDEAVKHYPKSSELRAKQAILAAVSEKKRPIKRLSKICQDLEASQNLEARKLGLVLEWTLVHEKPVPANTVVPNVVTDNQTETQKAVQSSESSAKESAADKNVQDPAAETAKESKDSKNSTAIKEEAVQVSETSPTETISSKDGISIIEKGISKGWYQDNAKILYYTAAKNSGALKQFRKQLEDTYYDKLMFMMAAYSAGGLCAFIGLVVIVIHFGSLGRKDPKEIPEAERVGIELDLRTIYSVFVGWMTCELMVANLFKLLPKGMLNLGGNPIGIAAFSLISYVITMVPAFLLIYFVAFKPRGLKFFDALKLRTKTATSGPFKLILAGFLSWCAIIPMVLVSALIASNFLGSQGSDNPVLSQISMVANSKNFAAIALLYFTVAAAAPFFEEIIFRGFLYSSLKMKWGIFPAILVSAFVFAFIHFDKGGALMLFALGPVLAVSYERSRSLLPAMIAHGLWNGGSFAMAVSLYS